MRRNIIADLKSFLNVGTRTASAYRANRVHISDLDKFNINSPIIIIWHVTFATYSTKPTSVIIFIVGLVYYRNYHCYIITYITRTWFVSEHGWQLTLHSSTLHSINRSMTSGNLNAYIIIIIIIIYAKLNIICK